MNYAVIDIGTNTLLLLIAKTKGKSSIEVVCDRAEITRLGQGLINNHFFLAPAMKRTLETIGRFKELCETKKVKKIFAIGTAACRTAANNDVFINNVLETYGIKVNVISGHQEAEYAFASAWKDFGPKKKKLIVVDIGGGSTEIITGPLIRKNKIKGPETVTSLPLGSVRLTEEFVHSDPISEEELHRLVLVARNGLKDELDDFYPETFDPSEYTLVATAGTATTLAAMDLKLKKYQPSKVHGKLLLKERLEEIISTIIPLPFQERQKLPGIEPLRADVILAGAIILNELLQFFDQKEAIISDRGVRYGAFYKKFLK